MIAPARIGAALRTWVSSPLLWAGVCLGAGLGVGIAEAPYVNWRAAAPPLADQPLLIRHDGRGDGRFAAPRSGGRRHRGVDLVAPVGAPVRAIRSGVVLQVGEHRGLGRYVELEHARHLHSLYAHLSAVTVGVGDRVRQGGTIGLVGKTGNARHPGITPHLHLEVFRAGGQPIDPRTLGLVAADPGGPPGLSAGAEEMDESQNASGGE